ncbi:MAG: AVAST type 1 anti-phage system protein Avs1c [Colwellia sp.]
METPATRSEFEHRFHLLENSMKNGKMHVAQHISMEGMLKVRRLPNGRLDFLSVNESARLQANMMFNVSKMDFPEGLGSNDGDPSPQG